MPRAAAAAGAESRSRIRWRASSIRLPLPVMAQPVGTRADPTPAGEQVPYYRVAMRAIASKLHRDLPPTRIVVLRRVGARRDVRNAQRRGAARRVGQRAAASTFLPIDHTLHGAEAGMPEVRSVVHVHGGKAPPESDGYPEDWYRARAVAHLLTIRTSRTRRCSGITITPWASTG